VGTGAWEYCGIGTVTMHVGTKQEGGPGGEQARQGQGNLPSSRPVFAAVRAARLLARTVATLGRGLIQGVAPGRGRSKDRCGEFDEQWTLKRSSGASRGAR
jgi:hypothetical protein